MKRVTVNQRVTTTLERPVVSWMVGFLLMLSGRQGTGLEFLALPHWGRERPATDQEASRTPAVIEVPPPPISKELKRRWSYFIRKVYETDPLVCPKCSGEMRIISFID